MCYLYLTKGKVLKPSFLVVTQINMINNHISYIPIYPFLTTFFQNIKGKISKYFRKLGKNPENQEILQIVLGIFQE